MRQGEKDEFNVTLTLSVFRDKDRERGRDLPQFLSSFLRDMGEAGQWPVW